MSRSALPTVLASNWSRTTLAFGLGCFVLFGLAAAPAKADLDDLRKTFTEHQVAPEAIVDVARVWDGFNIPVCWKTFDATWDGDRTTVRSAVEKYLIKESGSKYVFVGWGQCTGAVRHRIEISVDDTTPNSMVGQQGGGYLLFPARPTVMVLNFSFKVAFSSCASSDTFRRRCIEGIAVHEFMHALGFIHEHLDPDLARKDPTCFSKLKQRIARGEMHDFSQDDYGISARAVTDYDPLSVVNYCRNLYAGPPTLSPLDVVGLKWLEAATQKK